MPKVSVSTESAAGPDQVWLLATDLPRYAEWNTMHESFAGDLPAAMEPGATYTQRVKLMGMPADMAWKVTAAEAPGRLEMVGDGPMGVKSHQRFLIEAAGTGSQITLEMEMNGPALAGPMAAMVEKQAGAAAALSLAKFAAMLTG